MPIYAAVDVGGTFLKGAIVTTDEENLQFVVRRKGAPLLTDVEGRAELDPLLLLDQVRLLVRDLVANVKNIDGILFTGQMHGWVLTDDALNPMSRVVTWRDELQSLINDQELSAANLVRESLTEKLVTRTGNELRSGLPICTLKARASRANIFAGYRFHSLISYAAHGFLEDYSTSLMHVTDAAASGFFDVNQLVWDEEVLQYVGLLGLKLPRTTTDIEKIGISTTYKCPVYVAVGDQQASLYSARLTEDEISLNIATGSQVSRITSRPSYRAQVRPYFDGKYLSTVTHIPAGRSLNLLVDILMTFSEIDIDDIWKLIESKTEEVPYSDLHINLSFFDSYSGKRGEISSINEQNLTVGHLFRSASATMASTYRTIAELIMEPFAPTNVVITGGLARRFRPLKNEIEQKFREFQIREFEDEDASLGGLRRLALAIT
jgi:sugar (pentulose or hexulose) kinase